MTSTDARGGTPLVSVCIPTRDRADYLREAIASALAEDIDGLELVVCDDASTDHTASVVREADDARIVYRRHDAPLGVAGNRNACLEIARGRYLAWLDDDDAYLPGGLRAQLELLEREPDVVLAHAAIEAVDGEGRPGPPWPVPFPGDTIETGEAAFGELLLSNYVRAPTAVVRAEAQRAAGAYATSLGDRAEDWDNWLRLALEGDVAFRAEPVARYRCHPASVSADRASSLAWLSSEVRVVRRALRLAAGRRPDARRLRRRARAALAARHIEAASDALARGQSRVAWKAMRRAARLAPPVADALETGAAHAHRSDEHRFYTAVRPALERIATVLRGTRFGDRLAEGLRSTDAWSGERTAVARRIRQVVPPGARVAAIDKWDPSLLHEAGRTGWHFPDLALSPDGYPAEARGAIDHLEAQRARGAEYLVVPRASFWWLEHYLEFARHLDGLHERVWRDGVCVIYRLAETRDANVA